MSDVIIEENRLKDMNMDEVADMIFKILKMTKFRIYGQLKLELKEKDGTN